MKIQQAYFTLNLTSLFNFQKFICLSVILLTLVLPRKGKHVIQLTNKAGTIALDAVVIK